VGLADLHIHTKNSDGTFSLSELFEYVEEHTKLDVIAVTEHDDIRGGIQAVSLREHDVYRFEVICGVEITTRHGHLIALGITDQPPLLASAEDTIKFIHERGGLAIPAHPMARVPLSFSSETIRRIQNSQDPQVYLDGVEVGNPTPAGRTRDPLVRQFNSSGWHLPEIGSSDAHFLEHVGSTATYFDGHTVGDLLRAVRDGKTHSIVNEYAPISPRRLLAQQARGLSATPRKLIGRAFSAKISW